MQLFGSVSESVDVFIKSCSFINSGTYVSHDQGGLLGDSTQKAIRD